MIHAYVRIDITIYHSSTIGPSTSCTDDDPLDERRVLARQSGEPAEDHLLQVVRKGCGWALQCRRFLRGMPQGVAHTIGIVGGAGSQEVRPLLPEEVKYGPGLPPDQ